MDQGRDEYCRGCRWRKSRMNPIKGVRIPGDHGKCTNHDGLCKNFRLWMETKAAKADFREIDPEKVRDLIMGREALFQKTDGDDGQPPAGTELALTTGDDHLEAHDGPMTESEKLMLADLEAVVVKNFAAYYAVGCALRKIDRLRLYREKAETFEKYCKGLEIAVRTAYKMITAADVVDELGRVINAAEENVPHGAQTINDKINDSSNLPAIIHHPPQIPLPANERQARALALIKSPERRAEVWLRAVDTAPNGVVTAAHVKKIAHLVGVEKVQAAVREINQRGPYKEKIERVSDDFKNAFSAFCAQVEKAVSDKFRYVSEKLLVESLDHLRNVVAPDVFAHEKLPMPLDDAEKAMAVGLTLYRADKKDRIIRRLTDRGTWVKHAEYQTEAAMWRALKAILQDTKAILG